MGHQQWHNLFCLSQFPSLTSTSFYFNICVPWFMMYLMPHQSSLLQIKWHQFVRNDAIAATTVSRPSLRPSAARRHNALFSQVARLPDDVPAYKTLNCQVNLSLGRPPSSQWHCRPGRPQLTRSGMTATYHLRISGGALSVVVIAERRYGPCWLSDDNNNSLVCLFKGPNYKMSYDNHLTMRFILGLL